MTAIPETDQPEVTLTDMLETGASYRQIDYWVRKGYLTPERGTPGSGYDRRWSKRDVRLCSLIVRLAKVVNFDLAVAWAREAVDAPATMSPQWHRRTVDGMTIMWTDERNP